MEENPKFFELIEELEKNGLSITEVKPTEAKPIRKTPAEKHVKRVSALVNLLQPLVVVPAADGGAPYIKFAIEDPSYRATIQDWIMAETKKFYKL